MRRLKDVRTPVANFFASGVLALGAKLGPFLWQFPPHMRYNAERFETFFSLLPKDTDAALALAHEHDSRLDERNWLEKTKKRPLRHAVEIRHASFANPEFIALLRRNGIALVVADTADRWPLLEDLTADFVYLRLHGDEELYASGYSDEALERWALAHRHLATRRAGRRCAALRGAAGRKARHATRRVLLFRQRREGPCTL